MKPPSNSKLGHQQFVGKYLPVSSIFNPTASFIVLDFKIKQLLLRSSLCLIVFEVLLQFQNLWLYFNIYCFISIFPPISINRHILAFLILFMYYLIIVFHLLLFPCFILKNFFSFISREVFQFWTVSNLLSNQSQFLSLTITHILTKLLKLVCFLLALELRVSQFSHSVMSDSLRPHGLQHARLPCPSATPGGYPNSCPLSYPSNRLILCRPLLLPPSIFSSMRIFSNESVLHIRWPKYWSFSFSISLSKEYSGLISFKIDWLDLLAVQGTLKSLLQHHTSLCSLLGRKAMTNLDSILRSRDITFPTKVCLLKAMVFPVVMYECESWTIKKPECQRIDVFETWF